MTSNIREGFPGGAGGKEFACQCRRCKRSKFDPWVRKIPWRRKWLPTPVFLLGKFQGQRSLVGYGPQCHKKLNMTEQWAQCIWAQSLLLARQPGNVLSAFGHLVNRKELSGFPGGSEVKASACNVGDPGSIPGSGRSPGEGNGNPLQYSCLENPMDGGAW